MCRASCNRKETLNHISQGYPRTHQRRIASHNAVSNYIKRHSPASVEVSDKELSCSKHLVSSPTTSTRVTSSRLQTTPKTKQKKNQDPAFKRFQIKETII
ncbi:hypothetical protein AVEN_182974-1 [Araneus ventricosus]|uniref:Uncharacterized protein n=1 Tax=Araneus ventricosus TaxID=182803 RepID=A0A4Y2L5G1_ARAVE|nr:hypothetical protein AVEN_182974-1 [Araneus ventricosus]